jgi:YjbE family integral membrane protein
MLDPAGWLTAITTGWNEMGQATFWVAMTKIMFINVMLSGDNAVVIALACRGLPPRQRLWGMVIGAGIAAVLLILFTVVFAKLMQLPYLGIVGGCALFYISAKLLVPEEEDHNELEAVEHLWRAVRIVVIADIIMSLDNVIAVAAAAQRNTALLVVGLGISIPMVIAGAALIMALLDRFPILVWVGAAVLGWVVGGVIATDPVVVAYLTDRFGADAAEQAEFVAGALGIVAVLTVGGLWRRARLRQQPAEEAKGKV